MAGTWFGEICSCCCLPALTGPAWVLLKYVLQTIFSGPVRLSVCLSVCLFRGKLVRAALTNHHKIFGGGQGPCQERLSPEPAKSVKVRARKGREIQILDVSH